MPTFKDHLGPIQQFTEYCLACGENTYAVTTCTVEGEPLRLRLGAYVSQLFDGDYPENTAIAHRLKVIMDRHTDPEMMAIELLAHVGRRDFDGYVAESIMGMLRDCRLPTGKS